MVLEGAMPIGLGWMPGMSGFRGEAKVGQPQGLCDLNFLLEVGKVSLGPEVGIDERQAEGQPAA